MLRKLFEITQLAIRLHDDRDQVTITITLPADHIPDIAHSADRITTVNTTQPTAAPTAETGCVDAVRAPGRARTGNRRIMSPQL